MKEDQFSETVKHFEIINEILLKIMEELVSINKKITTVQKEQNDIKINVTNIEEIQEVLRKEVNTYDLNQVKWQLKVERELEKLQEIV